ncbi:hypothetical protein SAY86_027907 [Trapa natans]|uniref:Uncharacterized protein n=1 Tax=Trapa natans TaxID=22666 RepID=A0AAN7LYG1_TRANT|nr:hypothetical protein SAY86_027907 [Trapa natans]
MFHWARESPAPGQEGHNAVAKFTQPNSARVGHSHRLTRRFLNALITQASQTISLSLSLSLSRWLNLHLFPLRRERESGLLPLALSSLLRLRFGSQISDLPILDLANPDRRLIPRGKNPRSVDLST